MRSDEEIRKNIEAALRWDARVDADEIDLRVSDGIAYLSGEVNTYTEKAAASELAGNAEGVANVENDIIVTSFTVETDATLIADIAAALLRDSRVDAEEITVNSRNGVIQLSGKVATLDEKASAEEDARNNFGVTDVVNDLEVVPPLDMSDNEVIQAVMEELDESQELPEDLQLTVKAENGKVYVSGRLENISQRQSVENIVWHTPGVRDYVPDIAVGE